MNGDVKAIRQSTWDQTRTSRLSDKFHVLCRIADVNILLRLIVRTEMQRRKLLAENTDENCIVTRIHYNRLIEEEIELFHVQSGYNREHAMSVVATAILSIPS